MIFYLCSTHWATSDHYVSLCGDRRPTDAQTLRDSVDAKNER
jgi:hypothetical protein